MKSIINTTILLSSAAAFFLAQQAGASAVDAEVLDGHLHLLARNRADLGHGNHRRHHVRNSKRSCSAGTGNAASSNNNGLADVAVSVSGSSATAQAKVAVGTGSAKTSSKSSSASASTSSSSSSSSTGSSSNGATSSASSLGTVSAFAGTNTGAILSWFRTDNSGDSTNGQSWCQTKYQDDWVCFAPDVSTMLNEFGGDYNKAAQAFCGREAIVTNPSNGKSITAFICDGFDPKWVRTPSSLDLTLGAFDAIYENPNGDKNIVVQGATWQFTGNVVAKGTFKSTSS